jgi:hypothetical protein
MGFYDLLSGGAFIGNLYNEKKAHYPLMKTFAPSHFTPDAMSAPGVR